MKHTQHGFRPTLAVLAALAVLPLLFVFARPAAAQCTAPVAENFQKTNLTSSLQLQEPVELSVAKDGRVFVVERNGRIVTWDPQTNLATSAVQLDVYLHIGNNDVGGALGVAAAPDFPADNWVYVYYAPRGKWNGIYSKEAGRFTYHLSRFRFVAGKLDIATEQILFQVPSITETHNGGSLRFGRNGELWMSSGDNHTASCSDQYSPMDERPGFEYCDDQGTTANTNDLRGKIIRIRPEATAQANGKYYSIPPGNLKEKYAALWSVADQAKVLPEIYTMGHRNPYRIFPDPKTGRLYIGEFGPAANAASERGPVGADQLKVTDEPAFMGYPYFLKDNQPYCHWDYGSRTCVAIPGQSGNKFIAEKPLNNSRNNTGVTVLPPAKPAALWENDGPTADPIAGTEGCGFGIGPVYHFDPTLASTKKFPPLFDGKWIVWPIYQAGWQPKLATPPSTPFGRITTLETMPFNAAFSPGLHDMEFGPDGSLFAVDYGTAQYARNGDAALYRITYNGCLPPVAARPLAQDARLDGRLALEGGSSLSIPAGARGLEVFDLSGKRVHAAPVDAASGRTRLPAGLARGLFKVRWN